MLLDTDTASAARSKQSKSKEICAVTKLLGNDSYIVGKPVHAPLNGVTLVRNVHLWGEQPS